MSNDKRGSGTRGIGYGVLTAAAGLGVVEIIPDTVPYADTAGGFLVATGVVIAGVGGALWYRGRRGSSAAVNRLAGRSRHNDGTAGWLDHLRESSSWAMRRQATTLRPSLAELSWYRRMRVPVTHYAARLARVGRHTVWSACEDVTLRVGGPRFGKSAELAGHIVDAPGAVVATSTRKDLVLLTAPIRSQLGPIHIFNPNRQIDWASTIKWNPLVGCTDVATAQRRAGDMIPHEGGDEAERWATQGRRVLGLLMHAAALDGLPMRAVLAWMSEPGPQAAETVEGILVRKAKDTPEVRSLRTSVRQFFATNDRTKSSITTTIMPALAWLADPRAAQLGDAEVADDMLDVPTLLSQRGTLYLLGAEDGLTAPLIAALTAEIAHQARALAGQTPTDRLDPPLTMVLDEAGLACPVDLPRWTADMGGKGITLHIGVQGRSQLRRIWGEAGAADILNNAGTVMVFGGTKDPDDLQAWSQLSGERVEVSRQLDEHGKLTGYQERTVPVLSPAQIQQLRRFEVMIIRRGMPVAIGRTGRAWKRRDVRRAQKRSPFVPIPETNYGEQGLGEPGLAGESGA